MDEKIKEILKKDKERGITKGVMLSAILVSFIAGFGVGLYFFMSSMDENIAYMAMYLDNTAVDLYNSGACHDSIALSSGLASSFCKLYGVESRTLDKGKFDPLCDAINARSALLIMCGNESYTCPDYKFEELSNKMVLARPLAEYLTKNPPYFSYAFKNVLYFAGEEVKPIV